jgi:hypothetical protein
MINELLELNGYIYPNKFSEPEAILYRFTVQNAFRSTWETSVITSVLISLS